MPCVVIAYRLGPDNGAELRYTLRSLDKYLAHADVVLIGDRPAWATSLVHIPYPDTCSGPGHAYRATAQKLLRAVVDERVPDEFLLWADDKLLLRPVGMEHMRIRRSTGTEYAKVKQRKFGNALAGPDWVRGVHNTVNYLKQHVRPTWSYETHLPRHYRKAELLETFERVRPMQGHYAFDTLHLNLHYDRPDVVMGTTVWKGGIYTEADLNSLPAMMDAATVLNWRQDMWRPSLEAVIRQILPDKCRFEK
jgi:hypothetical protein